MPEECEGDRGRGPAIVDESPGWRGGGVRSVILLSCFNSSSVRTFGEGERLGVRAIGEIESWLRGTCGSEVYDRV